MSTMVTSQNGWPASADRRSIRVEYFAVAGVDFPGGVRGGDVATVLGYVARRFHAEVEPLHEGWCWGYNYRPITGGGQLSNHASGTAIDINAPDHPYGKRGTFSNRQVSSIRSILSMCAGVVRWGGDYSGNADEMHFEIVAGAQAVASLAARLRAAQPREEDEMTWRDMMNERVGSDFGSTFAEWENKPGTAGFYFAAMRQRLDEVEPLLREINDKVDALTKALGQ